MKKLNELIDRYDVSCHCGAVYVSPKQDGHLVMYSDYASLAQRAEAAEAKLALVREQRDSELNRNTELEAKLAELEKQEPVGYRSTDARAVFRVWPHSDGKICVPVYERPALAVSLAELVPVIIPQDVYQVIYHECGGFVDVPADATVIWNACRAAILRNIEEQSQ